MSPGPICIPGHYNRFRYYSPELGRYISADPIGQLGGLNLYSYVFNNPGNRADRYGLSVGTFVARQVAKLITKVTGKEVLSERVYEEIFGEDAPQSCPDLGPNACDRDGDGEFDWLDSDEDGDGIPNWRDPDRRDPNKREWFPDAPDDGDQSDDDSCDED